MGTLTVYRVSTEANIECYYAKNKEEALKEHLDFFPIEEEWDKIDSVEEVVCSKCEKNPATVIVTEMICRCDSCEDGIQEQRMLNQQRWGKLTEDEADDCGYIKRERG